GFYSSAAHSKNICLIKSAHSRNTDSRKQGADGGRGEADKQSYQGGNRGRIINSRLLCREYGIGIQRHSDKNKYNGKCNKENLQRDFIRRLFSGCALDHCNHFIKEAFACFI